MKKVLTFVLIFVLLGICGVCAHDEFVINDLGTAKIIADRYAIPTPHGTVYSHTNYGVVDDAGNIIVEKKYQLIHPHYDGRAMFKDTDGNIGFFDENWDVVIEAKYFSNGPDVRFSDGLAAVGKRDDIHYILWGYIDRNGNEITDFVYNHAGPFENGIAWVGIDEHVYGAFNTKTKWGAIDKDGNVVHDFKFGYALGRDYEYLWQEPVDVLLSENLVELNGIRYKNSDIEYPFINYLGYSYMPLSYYGCRMMGINCDWTPDDGVMLADGGVPLDNIIGDNGMREGVYDKAMFYKGKLSINGKVYEYGDTAYPLIHYKNVVYMPVCWENGMHELGIDYEFVGHEKLENSDRGVMIFKTK